MLYISSLRSTIQHLQTTSINVCKHLSVNHDLIYNGAGPPLTLAELILHLMLFEWLESCSVQTCCWTVDKHITSLCVRCDKYAKSMMTITPHVHLSPAVLLCWCTGWCFKQDDRQAAKHPQCSCTSAIELWQVWPKTDPVLVPHRTLMPHCTLARLRQKESVFKCTSVSAVWLPNI